MKCQNLLVLIIVLGTPLYAQVTLEECQNNALDLYPSLRQTGLIEKAEEYSIERADTIYLPRITLSGKASYQSEVTSFPLSIPGITVEEMSKDQYQILVELNQSLWDGGRTAHQKEVIRTGSQVERKSLDVELYSLKSRVNQIYFGILLLEEQLKQNSLLTGELELNYNRVVSLNNFGMAKTSDLNTVRVEQLKAQQAKTEITTGIRSYRKMLSQITGLPMDEQVILVHPEPESLSPGETGLNRPEMVLFQAQKEALMAKEGVIQAGTMPRINAFIQGGYGRPGLNMLDNSFTPFYIGGIRLNWSLDSFYTRQSELHSLDVEKLRVESRMDTFIYNTKLQLSSLESNIDRLQQLIEKDNEIILLRSSIKKDSEIQLENGTITINDLIRDINEENLASQRRSLHEIQLLQALYDLKFTLNK